MNRTPVFEDHISEWLEVGPTRAPDSVLENILDAFPSVPQRRVAWRVPWFVPAGIARALAGFAALAVVAAGALLLSNGLPTNQSGALPSLTPSAAPSPSPIDTSAWTPFASARHGVSVRYPADWTVARATAPWPPTTESLYPPDQTFDTFTSPTRNVVFAIASQPLPDGVTGEAWVARREASMAASDPTNAECWPAPAAMEQSTVEGLPAWIHSGCGSNDAFVVAGGRVYWFDQDLDPFFNRPLFDAFLSTVTFDPTNADDTPAASPRPGTR